MDILQPQPGAFDAVLKSHERVIVKFYADWCGSCKLFTPKFRRLSAVPRFESIAFVDVNAENDQSARALAGVDNLPFFATFKNGVLLEGTATAKEESVIAMLERLTA